MGTPKGPEAVIERHLRQQVERHGGVCLKFLSTRAGVPDRLVVLNGHTLLVELKAPKDGRLSALQRHQISLLCAAGADVRVLHTIQLVDELIAELTTSTTGERAP